MTLRLVRCDAAAPQPWKNGGGVTREIVIEPIHVIAIVLGAVMDAVGFGDGFTGRSSTPRARDRHHAR